MSDTNVKSNFCLKGMFEEIIDVIAKNRERSLSQLLKDQSENNDARPYYIEIFSTSYAVLYEMLKPALKSIGAYKKHDREGVKIIGHMMHKVLTAVHEEFMLKFDKVCDGKEDDS